MAALAPVLLDGPSMACRCRICVTGPNAPFLHSFFGGRRQRLELLLPPGGFGALTLCCVEFDQLFGDIAPMFTAPGWRQSNSLRHLLEGGQQHWLGSVEFALVGQRRPEVILAVRRIPSPRRLLQEDSEGFRQGRFTLG